MTKMRKIVIGVLVVVAVVIVGVVANRSGGAGNFFMAGGSGVSTSAYQAVFLTNNQVYFGKLSNDSSQFPVLRDIYYLQVQGSGNPINPQDISLVKLGNELHGPTDEMRLNRDHILLIESLRSDSNVVDAIRRFEEDNRAEAQ